MDNKKKKSSTAGRLLGYLAKYYKGFVITVIFCIIISTLAGVAPAVFVQRLIDRVITPGLEGGMSAVSSELTSLILTLVAVYAAGVIASFTYTRMMAVVTQGTLCNLRKDMFNEMESLPIRYFDTHIHGDIMSTYTNDVDAIRQMIGQSMVTMVQVAIQFIALIVLMLYYSVWLTLIVAAGLVAMFFFSKYYSTQSTKYMRLQQKELARTEGFAEEMMGGQKVVQVFCHEEESKKAFDKINDELFGASDMAFKMGHTVFPIMNNLNYIVYILVAVAGSAMVYFGINNICLSGSGAISIGVIVTFLGMARQLSGSVGQISAQIPMISMGMAGAGRVFEIIDEEPEADDGFVTLKKCSRDNSGELYEDEAGKLWAWKRPNLVTREPELVELEGDVVFEHVNFGYTEGHEVLHDISLYARPGQKIAFVGATGAGKTTITNLINRFYDITDGKIRYDGTDIGKVRKPDLRHSLGIVLQDVNLFTGTVMENIRYGRLDATEEECIAAAKLANADDFITRLPDGYDTMLTGDGASLSQGQKQLISIARAAVADPPVMILDEATSSIDTRTEALVQEGMDNLMKGRTVFVIAHRLSTVHNSDAIMVLDHGRIIERGSHEDLIAQHGVYYQLYTGAFELE